MEGKIIGMGQRVQSDQVEECCWLDGDGRGAGKSKQLKLSQNISKYPVVVLVGGLEWGPDKDLHFQELFRRPGLR